MNSYRKILAYLLAFIMLHFSTYYFLGVAAEDISLKHHTTHYDLSAFSFYLNSCPEQKQNSDKGINEYSYAQGASLVNRLFNDAGLSAWYQHTHLPYYYSSRILCANLRSVVIIFPFHCFG